MSMICRWLLVVFWLCSTLSDASASDLFVTDKPSPLRLANLKEKQSPVLKFKGSVRVSGTFVISREADGGTTSQFLIVLYPDDLSSSLLPRLLREDRVEKLKITSSMGNAGDLIDADTNQKLLNGEMLSATVDATVTISRYIIATVCDRRFYQATLLSVSKKKAAIATGLQQNRAGCG